MDIRFDTLFEIELAHTYYTSKVSEDSTIEPTPGTRRLMQDYGLLFRETSGGGLVLYEYYPDVTDHPHPVHPVEEELQFSFFLRSSSTVLLNYTDLDIDRPSDQILYFSNLQSNQQDGRLLLSADTSDEYVSSQDDLLLRPPLFNYSFQSVQTSVDMEVKDVFGNVVQHSRILVVDGEGSFTVDLRKRTPGKYSLAIDGSTVMEFYASDSLVRRSALGVIDILTGSGVPAAYRFLDTNFDVVPRTYHIRFNRRETWWKYYVVLKYRPDIQPDDLSIKQTGGALHFTRQSATTLPDGFTAVPFLSTAPIPLEEEPVSGLRLERRNHGHSETFEIDNLPNASVRTVTPDPAEHKIYSEIFIYV